MIQSLSAFIGVSIAMLTCLAAMVFGGKTERLAGAVLLVVNFASLVVQSHSDWVGPQYAVLSLDVASFALAIYLVLKTQRPWTIGYAAYQGLTVATHLVIQLEPAGGHSATRAWAYITGLVVWGYLIWVFLAWGTWSAWRARSRVSPLDAASGRNPEQ